MAFRKKRKLSKKEQKALKKEKLELATEEAEKKEEDIIEPKPTGVVTLPQIITVRDLSARFNLPVTKLIEELLKNGINATINESVDYDTAAIIAEELAIKVKPQIKEKEKKTLKSEASDKKNLKSRPPVVVVMGHVDHGKTTLLDYIRKTHVAQGEFGGITQHIGAYQVKIKDQKSKIKNSRQKVKNKEQIITFLDTPGHEAFSAMRAHGANITDMAILVVAADDGVKPQTKEAISHAKAAGIPLVVAINKIDKPEADVEKTKRQLADLGLVPEKWGGEIVMQEISAKNGKGVDKLLEMLLIVAEMEEFKANPDGKLEGVVIESHMEKGFGSVATVLIQNGKLKKGETIVIGQSYGRIKRMENDKGEIINEATLSMPVKIVGLKQIVKFGERIEKVENEKIAREKIPLTTDQAKRIHLSLGEISQKIKLGEIKELNIILKADTQGTLEAIKDALSGLSTQEVVIRIIHDGVGDINESDINLAVSSHALVIGFSVKVIGSAKQLASVHHIKISIYNVIYDLIDDLSKGLSGLLEPKIIQVTIGKLKVLKIFRTKKDAKIIGGKVYSGIISKGKEIKILREKEIIGQGKIETLEENKKGVPEVSEGFECGLGIKTTSEIKEGDIIEAFETKEVVRKIK